MKKILTLCIIHKHSRVLLGMKKRGFGAGKWNGFGGKVEPGENIHDAARRELKEEANLSVSEIIPMGVLDFSWSSSAKATADKQGILQVHIFKVTDFKGEPTESDEMKPKWFHLDEIPFDQMWQDDVHWLPLFLKDKKFKGQFVFDDSDNIISHSLEEIKSA